MKMNSVIIMLCLVFSHILAAQPDYLKSIDHSISQRLVQNTPVKTLSMLKVDINNPRHFADTLGTPVLLIGDSPQNLPQKLSVAQIGTYLRIAEAKG